MCHIGLEKSQVKTIIADSTHILLAYRVIEIAATHGEFDLRRMRIQNRDARLQKKRRLQFARTLRTISSMAQTSKPTKTRKRGTAPRTTPRRARESRATYRAPSWKIPNVTPIGSDAPVSKTLPLAVKRIVETLHPEKIILFGSYAYGNPTPDSDVDLLVVMETTASSADRSWSVSKLLIPRPFPVDILVRTPQEIKTALGKGDFFIEEITTQGKNLYERSKQPARLG